MQKSEAHSKSPQSINPDGSDSSNDGGAASARGIDESLFRKGPSAGTLPTKKNLVHAISVRNNEQSSGVNPSGRVSPPGKNASHVCQSGETSESESTCPADSYIKTNVNETNGNFSGSLEGCKNGKDKSKLRKGKWTVEEEEFATRIIQHFSTGLLTLPEGSTLRSYIAEKLNCDPMRITKKFAGATCLGRKVYHLVDRSQTTVAEMEMAKAELARLETRFRMRVEGCQIGMELSSGMLPSIPNGIDASIAQPIHPAAALAASVWVQNLVAMAGSANPTASSANSLGLAGLGNLWNQSIPWHVPPTMAPSPAGAPIAAINQSGPSEAIASLAWAQAAASLTPAISQLAATNLHHHQEQMQKAFDAEMTGFNKPPPVRTDLPVSDTKPTIAPAARLPQKPAIGEPPSLHLDRETAPPFPLQGQPADHKPCKPEIGRSRAEPAASNSRPLAPKPRSEEDEAAGSMLLGFISSLRQSYMEAVEAKEREGETANQAAKAVTTTHPIEPKPGKRKVTDKDDALRSGSAATVVTDVETSSSLNSTAVDSALEDSELSETNRTDPSSSEESDRDTFGSRGYGPPRKRLKGRHSASEFTRENVREHNSRMDALKTQGIDYREHS